MAFNGEGPPSKRQRLEESGRRNHEYGGYGDEPRRKREENNKPNHVLLYAIINPVYPITAEVLHTISAPCGQVQRIVILKKNGLQAMVEFDSVESATRAKETLHGADIYPGCCTLKIDFARPTKLKVYKNDTESWDYTTSTLGGAHRRQRVSLPLTLSPQSPGGARNSSDLFCRSKTPTTRAKIADTKSKTTGPAYEEVDSPPEVETLQLPSKTISRSRSVSPGKLPVELTLKVRTQMGRLAMMQEILDTLRHDSETLSEAELADLRAQVEETLKSFTKEHAHLEVVWPTAAVDHEYFAQDVHLQMQRAASEAKRIAARERVSRHAETSYPPQPKLSDIALPRFSGEYADWPSFFDLFTTMIMNQPRLEDAEKFYYLKRCLDGEPAQLISNLSVTGASLESALDLLRTKYENKRQLIQAHLEHLWTLPYTTHHSSRSLSQLLSTAIETRNAVNNLVEPAQLGDCLLVHHLTKHLDRATKKKLESSLGSSTSYPTFEHVTQFLTSRVRTLEIAESDQGKAAHLRQQTAQPKPQVQGRSTTHEGSTRGSPMDNCDCCGGQHFIVTCKKFGGLAPHDRVEWAREKRLCFNCLGRHSIKACRTRKGCKTCRERHHTMLHGGSRTFSGSFLIQAPTRRDLDRLPSRTGSRRSPSSTSDKR